MLNHGNPLLDHGDYDNVNRNHPRQWDHRIFDAERFDLHRIYDAERFHLHRIYDHDPNR